MSDHEGGGEGEGRSFADLAAQFPAIVPLPGAPLSAPPSRQAAIAMDEMPAAAAEPAILQSGPAGETTPAAPFRRMDPSVPAPEPDLPLRAEIPTPPGWGWVAMLVLAVGIVAGAGVWWMQPSAPPPVAAVPSPPVAPAAEVAPPEIPVPAAVADATPPASAAPAVPEPVPPDLPATAPPQGSAPPVDALAPEAAPTAPNPAPSPPRAPVFGSVILYYRPATHGAAANVARVAAQLAPMAGQVETHKRARLPRVPTIRYAHPADRAAAQTLADTLGGTWRLLEAAPSRASRPSGTLEVLLGG